MEPRAALPWKCCVLLTALLVRLTVPGAGATAVARRRLLSSTLHLATASCQILRCNSEFVAATLDLGGVQGSAGGASLGREAANAGYCGALRSYATCTRRMARACRGDLAYHSAVQGIEDLLIQHRCPRAGPTARPRPPPQGTLAADACLYEKGWLGREGRGPDYLHCSVFGDPHVRTFADDFQTCAVQGAWPVLDNHYLYIQATSSPARGGTRATALTKVTIIFKSWRQCVEQQLYQAELDHVPAAFADGSVRSGERRGQRSLLVWSQSPGRHAEIRAAHIGTVLVVRQSGRSLALSLRSPRGVVEAFGPEQDLQLCVWGCPASQRMDTLRPPPTAAASPAASPAAASAHCGRLLPARDVYYRACVFDILATGDLNTSAAAVAALQDARALISEPQRLHLRPVGSAQAPPARPRLLLLLLGTLGALRCGR